MRTHYLALILAFTVGLIYASHHFLVPRFLDSGKEPYSPITREAYYDESIFYAPRANAAFQGPLLVGDMGLFEHRNSPSVFPPLNSAILGALGRVLGSIRSAFIASDFLFPAAIFLVLYFLIWEITYRRSAALLFSSLFIFAPKLALFIPPPTALNARLLAQDFLPFLNPRHPLPFSQFDEPKLTFLFFALGFYFVVRALKRREKISTLLAGLAFGVMFYTYLYDWATFLAALSIAGILLFFQKDSGRVKIVLAILGIGAAVSVFYWLNLWEVYSQPQAAEILARPGGEYERAFRFATVWKSYLRNAVLAGALWFLWRKKDAPSAIVIAAFLLSYFITVNAQIVTGFNPHPDHWYRVLFLPVALAVFLTGFWFYERYLKRVGAGKLLAAFLIYFFAAQAITQYAHSAAYGSQYVIPIASARSYGWLAENTSPGSVVGSIAFDTNSDLLLHTRNKIFVPSFSVAAPNQEIWERFFFMNKIYGVAPEDFEKLLREGGAAYHLFMEEYGSHEFDASFGNYDRKFPEALIREQAAAYQSYLVSPLQEPPYRLNYLYLGERELALGQDPKDLIPGLEEVYNQDGIKIYKYDGR